LIEVIRPTKFPSSFSLGSNGMGKLVTKKK
jgi:hypothetical protein